MILREIRTEIGMMKNMQEKLRIEKKNAPQISLRHIGWYIYCCFARLRL